ncbi:AI-2E family transporter [Methylobacterium sp. P31]
MRERATNAEPRRETLTNRYVLAVLVAVLLLAYLLRYAVLPLAAAAVVAYATRPAVSLLNRRVHLPWLAAVLVVYIAILGLVAAACYWMVTVLADRLIHAAQALPGQIGQLVEQWAGPTLHLFGETFPSREVGQRAIENLAGLLAEPSHAMLAGSLVVAAPTTLVLTLVVLFYLLNSGRQIAEGVLWLAPPRYRPDIRDLARRVDPVLRRYVVGVLLVVAYTALVAWLFLNFVFGIPYALILAFSVGVLELVPVIGPAASMALLGEQRCCTGTGSGTSSGWACSRSPCACPSTRLVGPLLLGKAVTLHPVVIIFAFLTGATLFGVLGVLLAVPIASATKIVLAAWYGEEGGA